MSLRWPEWSKATGVALGLACLGATGKYAAVAMEPFYRPARARTEGSEKRTLVPPPGSPAPSFLSGLKGGDGVLVVFGDCESCSAVPPDVLDGIPPRLPLVAVRPVPASGKRQGARTINGYSVAELPASVLAPYAAEFTPRIYRYRQGRLVSVQTSFLYADDFVKELRR